MRIQAPAILLAVMTAPAAGLAADLGRPAPAKTEALPAWSPWSGYVAAGGGVAPDFPGAKEYKFVPYAIGRLGYGDFYVEAIGPKARINIDPGGTFEAGPLVSYSGGRDHDVENRRIKLLPEVKSSLGVGAFAKVNFSGLALEKDRLSLAVEFAKATGGHQGYTVDLHGSYGIQVSRPFFVSIDTRVTFADKKYTNAYFGVDAVGASLTGLPVHAGSAGATKVEAGLTARYMFSPNWGLTGRVMFGRVVGDAAKSPIVKQEGSENQISGGLGIVYRF